MLFRFWQEHENPGFERQAKWEEEINNNAEKFNNWQKDIQKSLSAKYSLKKKQKKKKIGTESKEAHSFKLKVKFDGK